VLDTGAAVGLEVLLDLRLLLALGRLVDGQLDAADAVPQHLGHQRRVLGGDVLVGEVLELAEAEDVGVVARPRVHLAELDVGDHVVDAGQADRLGERVLLLDRSKPGR
jgi:hypothetical protein